MDNKSTDKEKLKKEIQDRLNWYTWEASEEEVDENEMVALAQLLNVLEGDTASEKETDAAWNRFCEYKNIREEQEMVHEEIPDINSENGKSKASLKVAEANNSGADTLETDNSKTDTSKTYNSGALPRKRTLLFRRKTTRIAAAAVLVIAVAAGGSLGVSAVRNDGFFHWLKRDAQGVTVITEPEGLDGNTAETKVQTYTKVEDVPEEYREYITQLEDLDLFREYEWEKTDVNEASFSKTLTSTFALNNERILAGVIIHSDETMIYTKTYMNYEYLYSEDIGEKQIDLFFKEDPDGENIYVAFFYKKNEQFFISGKNDLDNVKKMIKVYRDGIFTKNSR